MYFSCFFAIILTNIRAEFLVRSFRASDNAHKGRVLFFAMPKIDYTKPWLDVPDQVAKLKARGLIVADMAEAERFLRYINYYRFSGFCLPFQYPHHARLWDKRLAISPMIPANKNWRAIAQCRQKVFIIALMLNWMLAHDSISRQDHTDWKKRLEALVDDFAARFPQLLHYTGFPTNWKKNPLWWQV